MSGLVVVSPCLLSLCRHSVLTMFKSCSHGVLTVFSIAFSIVFSLVFSIVFSQCAIRVVNVFPQCYTSSVCAVAIIGHVSYGRHVARAR
jgi:hypothetical protein